ncbi:diguanylate cyclase domain-containing protein [Paracidovorax valerianellae]|uniref:diguanylate cyclase domain-containing protein n=1 Tax=Paracidovorax valerianellae TaxID=187868 RepID=UPI0023047E9A|nr:diguanylate cyclase [Paracidovorax valerianellae]MDA8447312.1 diguanylate cyclase [Paracidovorax valerianellae]
MPQISPRRLVLLALVLSAGIGALFARAILTIRDDAWSYALQTNASLARTVEQNIKRTLDGFDYSLIGVAKSLSDPGLPSLGPEMRNTFLFDHSLHTPGLGAVAVLDDKGNVLMRSTSLEPVTLNLADREYFQVHKNVEREGVYVGKPIQGRVTGMYSLPISRAYYRPDGSFGGVVVGTVRISYFKELFASIDVGPMSRVDLWSTRDGIAVARFPYEEKDVGQPMDDASLLARLQASDSGSFTAQDAKDGTERLHTFRRIGGYPLVVSVGQSADNILAKWRASAKVLGAFAVLLMAACLGLSALFARELQRRQAIAAQLKQAEHDMRTILDNLPSLVSYWDKDQRNRFANQAYMDWLGVSPERMPDVKLLEVLDQNTYNHALTHIQQALKGHKQVFERTVPLPSGEVRHTLVSYIPDKEGDEVQGIFVQIDDLTDRKRMEDLLFEEKELIRLTLQSIGDAVICTDAEGQVTYINPVAEKMTGWQAFHAAGSDIDDVVPLLQPGNEGSVSPTRKALAQGTPQPSERGFVLQCRDGRRIDIEKSVSPIMDRHGHVTGTVMVLRDVTEAMEMSRRMAHLAQYDVLTDLPNRVLLQDRAQQAIAHAIRDNRSLALMYIDLDGFKQVNDTLGHDAGDVLLVQVARRFKGAVRHSDTVCRQGGDEFVVLLPSLDNAEQACLVSHKIMAACEPPFDLQGNARRIHLSGGIALFPQHGRSFEELARSADMAMYAAKRAGRGHFRLFEGADQEPSIVSAPHAADVAGPAATAATE